ncbi:hypothetical protein ACI2IY_16795 [Lysobacter enzymogenes]|uniref:hypothetical protein n=1 Tax=Lysobacter enzymogenes TaxID=69 RepID=UPI00384ED86F
MNKHLRVFFGLFASCGFLASLIVHLRTFWGYTLDLPGGEFLPALGLPVVIGALALDNYLTPPAQRQIVSLPGPWPWWALVVLMATGAYVALNFLVNVVAPGGSPVVSKGGYVLQEHGLVIRELTAQQYREAVVRQARGTSGHMLIFYLMPALWFLFAKKAPRSATE